MVMIRTGTRIAVIHAPSVNLATSTMTSVMPVARAPTPLMIMRRSVPLPPSRFQCITMPAWESVKARKAPMAKSGRSVTPPKTIRRSAAKPTRATMRREGRGETWEVRVRRVRREREYREDRADGDVVEPAAAHNSGGELGEDALVAGGAGVGGANRVGAARQCDASEEDHEQNDYDGEGPLGVLLRGDEEGAAVSLTPRTLIRVRMNRIARQRARVWGSCWRKAETSARPHRR